MNIKPLAANTSRYQDLLNDNRQNQNNAASTDTVNHSPDKSRVNNSAFSAPSVHEARKLLNDKIIAALEKTLSQSNQTSLYELDPADFSPEKVADRILSFVGAAFASLDSGDKTRQNQRLEAAREGIEKGFNDAKNILEGLGVFKDGIAENANKTYDLLQEGLDKMAANIESGVSVLEGLFNSKDADTNANANTAVSGTLSSLEQSSYLKQSFDFELTTQDGDRVTININRVETSQSSITRSESSSSAESLSSSHLTESGYSISVSGKLDENELHAIDKLLSKMSQVADKYFSGDTQAALDKVSQLGYNTSEIASFSLDLKEVQQSKATALYQELGGSANKYELGQLLNPLLDYAKELGEAHKQFTENSLLDGNTRQFQQLLNQVSYDNQIANSIFPDKNRLDQFENFNSALLKLISEST